MSIVRSEYLKPVHSDPVKGRLRVFEIHTDHNGDKHEHRYSCPLDHDTDQALLDWVPMLEQSLIDGEKAKVQHAIEEGVDHARITIKHLTAIQKARAIIKGLMLGNPAKMLKAAQFVEGFTNAQLLNFFTQAQAIRIRTRQNYILDNQATFLADAREEI